MTPAEITEAAALAIVRERDLPHYPDEGESALTALAWATGSPTAEVEQTLADLAAKVAHLATIQAIANQANAVRTEQK